MRFSDKVALVTGGSRGIGAETALLLAGEGAKVVFTYHSNKAAADDTLDRLGSGSTAVQADFGREEDVLRVYTEVEKLHRRLDILVNNVGITTSGDPLSFSLDDWNAIMATNVAGTFLSLQQAARLMGRNGAIVNVASLRGLAGHGRPPIVAYSTSKAAVISLTKTFAKALAPNVRVNSVSPGVTNTAIVETFTDEQKASFVESIYLGRLLEPIEIARSIAFLVSDDASGITGVDLHVDGGQSLSR